MKVVVLGSSSIDFTLRLERLPVPGETLLGTDFITGPGGKGANQAVAARRAGGDVVFLTALGRDDFGGKLWARYEEEGIEMRYARRLPDAPTGTALIFLGGDGANLIGVHTGANGKLDPSIVTGVSDAVFSEGGAFLACLEVPLETVLAGLERARRSGMTKILNPAPADPRVLRPEWLRCVDVLTPNQEEAALLAGTPAEEPGKAARELKALGARSVIVTLGGDGALVLDEAGEEHIPAFEVAVADTVGAGDAFNGALATALSKKVPLRQAVRWASAAAALSVTKIGAQAALPYREAIEQMLTACARVD